MVTIFQTKLKSMVFLLSLLAAHFYFRNTLFARDAVGKKGGRGGGKGYKERSQGLVRSFFAAFGLCDII
jgi:hypothetical protein